MGRNYKSSHSGFLIFAFSVEISRKTCDFDDHLPCVHMHTVSLVVKACLVPVQEIPTRFKSQVDHFFPFFLLALQLAYSLKVFLMMGGA